MCEHKFVQYGSLIKCTACSKEFTVLEALSAAITDKEEARREVRALRRTLVELSNFADDIRQRLDATRIESCY